ncbi:MAG: hypothetical protein RLZZ387_1859 [Chloroflexota bacterium]|jgi:hypothetical protein
MVNRSRRLVLLAALLLLSLLPSAALAQSDARCFTETGYCISGPIRRYWERNGGLPVFGYPIGPLQTEQVEDWSGPVQWFERDRLEDHTAQGYGVLAGRLGAEVLERQGRPWVYGNEQPGRPTGPCRYFAQTGYNVCNVAFRLYWEQNGGLERFGYPITPVIQETIEGYSYQVQYFERRRMEYHPENRVPYDVLLGLLGRDVFGSAPSPQPCAYPVLAELQGDAQYFGGAQALGCPVAGEDFSSTQGATASFERGQMYWVNLRGGRSVIVVLLYEPSGGVTYRQFDDTWREGDPVGAAYPAPPGLYEPSSGFGKVWREYPEIRSAIGWALETERTITPSYQSFERGRLLQVIEDNIVWLLDPRGGARSSFIRF